MSANPLTYASERAGLVPQRTGHDSTALVLADTGAHHQLATVPTAPPISAPPPPQPAPMPAPAPATASETIVSLSDLVRYLRRDWKRGTLFGALLATLAFIALGTGPKLYQAEAQLLLRIQDANVFNFEQLGRSSVGELSAPLLVNNHLSEMKSRRYVEYFHDHLPPEIRAEYIHPDLTRKSFKTLVMEWTGLAKPAPAPNLREVFIRKAAAATRVEPMKESFILRVQVRGEDPKICADLANRYVNHYIDYVAEQELGSTRAASAFLTQKAAELRHNLQESEARLASYRQQASVLSRSRMDGVKDTSGEKLQALNVALADVDVKLTRARYDLAAIEAAANSEAELLRVRLIADNPQVTTKRNEISALEAQLTPLLEFCGPRHPKVVGLNNELRSRRTDLSSLIAAVAAMASQEVATLSAQRDDFKRQVEEARGDVIALGDKEIQEKMLIDQVELDRQMYQNIVMRMNQANLTGEFTDNGLLRVADVATPPDKPMKPNKAIAALASMMVFGLVFLGVPIGWGLTEDHVLKLLNPAPVIPPTSEPAPAPVAAAPPPETTPASHQLVTPPPVAITQGNRTTILAEFPFLAGTQPSEVLSECLKSEPRGAATALRQLTGVLEKQALTRSGPGGIILITSSESSEGKSLAAAALAATFVHHGRKVLVIDCHAGGPGLHHYFPQSERHSSSASQLSDLRYGESGLYVLPAHDIPAYETNELLDGYRAWIDRARLEVDWIILDGPPVLKNFADVAPLAPLATDVIVMHDRSRATAAKLRAAMTLLQPMMSSSAMRGLLLNRA